MIGKKHQNKSRNLGSSKLVNFTYEKISNIIKLWGLLTLILIINIGFSQATNLNVEVQMAYRTETKFSDLQMDERYKKLEQSLKLTSLRDRNCKQNHLYSFPNSPSVSSIHEDPFDSSTNRTVQSLPPYTIDNKVVSSSNNLRNILLRKKCDNSDPVCKGIATSSVKKFNRNEEISSDFNLMPPPDFINGCRRIRNPHKVPTFSSAMQNGYNSSDIDASPNSYKGINASGNVTDRYNSLQINANNSKHKKNRIFRNWNVMLNDIGQLVIKGTLECGSIARSKPISRRLTSTTLQSICNHIYHLQGNIVDDAHDLPDYIRGKFYNGFPEDWKNVHEIWATFVRQGSSTDFHWPTRITDSDDDIKSDTTCVNFGVLEDKSANLNALEKFDPLYNSNFQNNPLHLVGEPNFDVHNYKESNFYTQTCKSGRIGNSFHKGIHTQISSTEFDKHKVNCKEQKVTDVITESLARKLKDNLNVILKNIMDKNCSKTRVSQYFKMCECLNYILSYGSVTENEFDSEGTNAGHKAQENYEIEKTYHDYPQREVNSAQSCGSNKIISSNNFSKRKRTFAKMNMECDNSNSDGESELYTGIPKISLERIMRQKENWIKPRKRKIKKNASHSKVDTMEKEGVSKVPEIQSDKLIKNINDNYVYDSSVSIIESRRDNLMVNKSIKHVQSDIVQDHQRKRSDDQWNNKPMLGMREHFTQENCTAKPTPCTYNSYDPTDDNENEIAVTKTGNSEMSDVNSSIRTKQDTFKEPKKFPFSLMGGMRKTTKPVIISSVSTNIDIVTKPKGLLESQEVITNEEVAVAALSEESDSKTLKQNESTKKPDAVEKLSTTLVTCSKECVEEYAKIPLSNRNFTSKDSAYKENLIEDDQVSSDNKPRMLSAWNPRVICKSGLHLIFEGELLNDAGHVIRKKFKTGVVLRRVSPKVIETVGHKLYELIGELNNTKYVVPKQLVMHCRYGCPHRIERFCKTWNMLRSVDDLESASDLDMTKDRSMDSIHVGVSSKGRRIIPPLSYWTGERIVLKDNNPMYRPSTVQGNLPTHNTSIRNKQVKDATTRRKSGTKKAEFIKAQNLPERPVDKSTSSIENKMVHERPKKRRRIIRSESSSSADDFELSNHGTRKSGDGTELTNDKLQASNKEIVPSIISPSKKMSENHQSSSVKYRDVVCTYYPDVPAKDDVLSDFQGSYV